MMDEKQMEDTQRTWSVWAEGFAATGERGVASLLGRFKGETFLEACRACRDANPANRSFFSEKNGNSYYWGCRLFDNEVEARKRFG
jgi:hypothetical protein